MFKRLFIAVIVLGLIAGGIVWFKYFRDGMIAQYIRYKTGPEWFSTNRNIIVAGLAVGEGVVIGLFAAIAALKNSLIALPY